MKIIQQKEKKRKYSKRGTKLLHSPTLKKLISLLIITITSYKTIVFLKIKINNYVTYFRYILLHHIIIFHMINLVI